MLFSLGYLVPELLSGHQGIGANACKSHLPFTAYELGRVQGLTLIFRHLGLKHPPYAQGRAERLTWAVFNQTHTPPHQRLFERLSRELGPCRLLTGTPFPVLAPTLDLKRGPAYRRGSFIRRVTSWLLFSCQALWVGMFLPRGTLLLVVTNPPLLPHVAWLLRYLRGVRYVVLVWDVYPDLLVAAGLLGKRHLIVRAWRSMNRRVMKGASLVIAAGEVMAEEVRKQFADSHAAAVEVIPNWGETEVFKPLPKSINRFARRHDQLDKITVLYAGNVGSAHGVERIVWIADRMRDDTRFSFLIVGDGLGLPKVSGEVSRLCVPNVKVLGRQPWELVPEMLAAAEIAVVLQEKGTERLSMPSKTYSSMAVGSLILALTAPTSDLASVVLEHDIGVVCDQDDIDGAAASLRLLASDAERLEEARRRSRRAAMGSFAEDVIYRRWLRCLGDLIEAQGPGSLKRRA